jgi:hypothetical protein
MGPSVLPVVIHMQNISVVYKIQFAFRTLCCCSRLALARTINIIGSGPFHRAFPERCRIKLDVLFALCSAVGWNTREINADSANQRVFMYTEVSLHTTTPPPFLDPLPSCFRAFRYFIVVTLEEFNSLLGNEQGCWDYITLHDIVGGFRSVLWLTSLALEFFVLFQKV